MASWTSIINSEDIGGSLSVIFIIENNINSLKLFPNPVHSNIIYLSNPQQIHGKFMIYNSEGKAIRNGKIAGIPRPELDIKELTPAIYFMQVNNELGTKKMKIVVL